MANPTELETRNLAIFLIITFAVSWLIWLPAILFELPITLVYFLYGAGACGPLIGAFLTTYLIEKREGIKYLFNRLWTMKFDKKWFIPTILLFPVLAIIVLFITASSEFTGNLISIFNPGIIILLFLIFFSFGMGEEYGWRGFVQDRLQRNLSALTSSIIVGLFWAVWHLPLFFMRGAFFEENKPFFIFLIVLPIWAISSTWLYNNTNRSVLIVSLLHGIANVCSILFMPLVGMIGYIYFYTLLALVDIALIIIYGPKRLSRQKSE